jgi:purine-binding chemotaxis protein CheW
LISIFSAGENSVRARWEKEKKTIHEPDKEDAIQLIGFGVGQKAFGADIMNVLEILRDPVIENPAGVPDCAAGVIILRDQVIPVVDLRKRLERPRPNAQGKKWALVVKVKGRSTGYIVDSVSRIIKIQPNAILPPPDLILDGLPTPYIRGVCTVDGQLIIVLNFKQMLSIEEDQALENMTVGSMVHLRGPQR